MGNAGPRQTKAATPKSETVFDTPEMLQTLIDSLADYAIILVDPDGRVRSWSPAAERLKGWKADEIIGQPFSRFYTEEDVRSGKPQRELADAERNGRYEDEGWRVRKDGTPFWANVIITPVRDAKGKVRAFGKVTRDLTDRRRAEDLIRKQAQEILEMIPIVQVWDGVVLTPLIGTLDSQRTQELMERLLQRVADTSSRVAILDITGVATIDTQTAQHLIDTITAVRLIGAEVILTGVGPVIAQTLVHLGIDLSNVMTRSSLAAGLRVALDLMDLKIVSKTDTAQDGAHMAQTSITVAKIRDVLMVVMPPDPDDSTIAALQEQALQAMAEHESRALILDISAVETLDSFFARTVTETAQMIGVMGGRTIVAGMRPAVALTATQLGLVLRRVETALDVDQALDMVWPAGSTGGPV